MIAPAPIIAAERSARALAVAIIDRAAPREAGRAEMENATTAAEIIQAAELKAGQVDRSTFTAMKAEIEESAEEAEARIRTLAQDGATSVEIERAVQQAVAESETKERAMRLFLDRGVEAAWEEACDKLRTIARN
jgi:hypothetical protein